MNHAPITKCPACGGMLFSAMQLHRPADESFYVICARCGGSGRGKDYEEATKNLRRSEKHGKTNKGDPT